MEMTRELFPKEEKNTLIIWQETQMFPRAIHPWRLEQLPTTPSSSFAFGMKK